MPGLKVVFAGLLCLAAALGSDVGHATDWPQKPVRIIVPFPAGGSADGQARIVAQRFGKTFGQQFVVENRVGAGGALAVEAVVRAPADGYTLLWGIQPQIVVLPAMMDVRYDSQKDLVPISVLGTNPFVLVINSKLPVKSLKDFVSYVQGLDKPLPYGTSGVGSIAHLSMALFAERAKLNAIAVHYKGNAPALSDVLAGHIPAMFATLADALSQAQSLDLRIVAVTGQTRAGQLPDVPTIAESGYPDFSVVTWNGLMAPAGTPAVIVDKIAGELAQAVKDPDFAARVTKFGVDPLGNSPRAFAELIAAELPLWKKAVGIAGVNLKEK